MKQLRRIFKYIRHVFTAKHSYGFRVHSPYIFNFTKYVIYEKNPYYIFPVIEKIRGNLENDKRIIQVNDLGTGKSGKRKVGDIASKSLKSSKYSQLLFRIVQNSKTQYILEMGTSLGITTSYLASANKNNNCVTMEGAAEIARIASETFEALNLSNIKIVTGDINQNLPSVIEQMDSLGIVFIDANHTSKAVLKYFDECLKKANENTIFIIDDIYWSKDMERAWKAIKGCGRVSATIDLFQLGIVFFNRDLHKKHYKMLL